MTRAAEGIKMFVNSIYICPAELTLNLPALELLIGTVPGSAITTMPTIS